MSTLATSFRMYNAGPHAAAAWRAMFERVFAELSLDIRLIEHGWPEPIATLWQRPDLCCAFMCGWPFLRSQQPMQAIAVPVPSPARYAGLPRYCSELLVRSSTGWTTLEETFGHRFGWMADDSQSGFNAPRAHLATLANAERPSLFGSVHGPLGTPMRTLDALRNSEVDVVALDSYFLDLCRLHQPEKLAGLGTVASTPWTPMPLLVAAPAIAPAIVDALQTKLVSLHEDAAYRPLMAAVLVERFVVPDVKAYDALGAMQSLATERGYDVIR
jgi:ABC-type phosphate/phosphonate transport system substrate-binding protein